jgi:AhpC/TSA family protein
MEATILYGPRETTVQNATLDGDSLWLSLADLERATGWERKPQGLCFADVCVPLSPDRRSEWLDEQRGLDLTAFARHLRQPSVGDQQHRVWAFGDAANAGGANVSVEARDFTLPDLDGRTHSLSDYRGKKVFLFCWASW